MFKRLTRRAYGAARDLLRRVEPLPPLDAVIPVTRVGDAYNFCVFPATILGPSAIVYAFGAGEDLFAETEIARWFGCDVHIFDPTPRSRAHYDAMRTAIAAGQPFGAIGESRNYLISPAHLERLHFTDVGLWDRDETVSFFAPAVASHVSHSITNIQKTEHAIEVPVRTLATLMAERGHDHIDFLKLDIEGAEYRVLDDILRPRATPLAIGSMYVEFHHERDRSPTSAREVIRTSVRRLAEAGFHLVHNDKDRYLGFVHASRSSADAPFANASRVAASAAR